ncbi:hypothetical protein [Bradyrhizobium jicamae]|uniref:hypothetical protein n=1 Tax=Bradyrhizobium jicamae TaxID=280332 RepID=UPI0028A0BEEF|nr:hypothetical protein [Bradyrhizobium jicamae]
MDSVKWIFSAASEIFLLLAVAIGTIPSRIRIRVIAAVDMGERAMRQQSLRSLATAALLLLGLIAPSFTRAGGRAEYHLLPPFRDEGHFLIGSADSIPTWSPYVERFLDNIR